MPKKVQEMSDIEIETGDVPIVEDFAPEPMADIVVSPDVALQKVSGLGKTIESDIGRIFDMAVAALDKIEAHLVSTLAKYQAEAADILADAARDINHIKPRIDDLRNKARRARSGEV